MRSLPSLFSVPNSFHAATLVTGVPSGYLASEKKADFYGIHAVGGFRPAEKLV